jgi:hypothetical protein
MTQRPQDQQPKRDANEQSGSTGRNAGSGDARRDGKNSGQDKYGMPGEPNTNAPQPGHDGGSSGTSEYGRSDTPDGADHEHGSNHGSGSKPEPGAVDAGPDAEKLRKQQRGQKQNQ